MEEMTRDEIERLDSLERRDCSIAGTNLIAGTNSTFNCLHSPFADPTPIAIARMNHPDTAALLRGVVAAYIEGNPIHPLLFTRTGRP